MATLQRDILFIKVGLCENITESQDLIDSTLSSLSLESSPKLIAAVLKTQISNISKPFMQTLLKRPFYIISFTKCCYLHQNLYLFGITK